MDSPQKNHEHVRTLQSLVHAGLRQFVLRAESTKQLPCCHYFNDFDGSWSLEMLIVPAVWDFHLIAVAQRGSQVQRVDHLLATEPAPAGPMGRRAVEICKVVALQKVPHALLFGKLASNMLDILYLYIYIYMYNVDVFLSKYIY